MFKEAVQSGDRAGSKPHRDTKIAKLHCRCASVIGSKMQPLPILDEVTLSDDSPAQKLSLLFFHVAPNETTEKQFELRLKWNQN